MPINRLCDLRSHRLWTTHFRLDWRQRGSLLIVTLCLVAPRLGYSQTGEAAFRASERPPVERELIIEALASYGNYRIFASGTDCKLYTAGVEYDRHSWGYFLKAQMDYTAEFLPVVILIKPAVTDIWGNPKSTDREVVPGIGFSPIGFRMLWRSKKALKPYLIAKGGLIVFDKKVVSSEATYENFSLQDGVGLQIKLNEKWDLRLGLFNDFHFSNAFIVPVNPGLDVMNSTLGLSYHFTR